MKSPLVVAMLALLYAAIGCEPQPQYKQFPAQQPNPQNSAAATSPATEIESRPVATPATGMARIPLNKDDPQAHISAARNFYVVFDGSGSMDEGIAGGSKIDIAKKAMREWIKSVPAEANLGLWVFDTRNKDGAERLPLGPNNHQKFLAEIEAVQTGSGTPLASAMRHGVDALTVQYQHQLGYGEYRLVVVTDGENTEGGFSAMASAGSYAASVGIPIYSIGLAVSNRDLKRSSISYVEANNLGELQKSLSAVLAEADYDE